MPGKVPLYGSVPFGPDDNCASSFWYKVILPPFILASFVLARFILAPIILARLILASSVFIVAENTYMQKYSNESSIYSSNSQHTVTSFIETRVLTILMQRKLSRNVSAELCCAKINGAEINSAKMTIVKMSGVK